MRWSDRRRACAALRTVLHVLRDRLTIAGASIDAGMMDDARLDAAAPAPDAGMLASGDGCSCRAGGARHTGPWLILAGALGAFLARRGRR
jgi:MYXO-CTERM domain-containing protein